MATRKPSNPEAIRPCPVQEVTHRTVGADEKVPTESARRALATPWGIGIWALFSGLSLLPTSTVMGQVVHGRILDSRTGDPMVSAVAVLLDEEGAQITFARSDSLGEFTLVAPGPGRVTVEAGQIGYFHASTPVLLMEEGMDRTVEIHLPPDPFVLDPINVEAESRIRRELRMRPTATRRLGPARIQEIGPQVGFDDLLRFLNAPSLRIHEVPRYPGSGIYDVCVEWSRGPTGRNSGCRWVAMYVDGIPISDPSWVMRFTDPSTIWSIELISPTEAGARWGTGSQNGVLLITTITGRGGRGDPVPPGLAGSQEPDPNLRIEDWLVLVGSDLVLIGVTEPPQWVLNTGRRLVGWNAEVDLRSLSYSSP